MSDPVTELWAQRLIDATHLAKGHAFLDVGGGDGRLCAAIESLCGAVGTVLDAAVNPDTAPSNHIRGKAEALPFADSVFDAVFLNHIAHLLKRPIVALREAVRVVRPGGRIAIRFSSLDDLQTLPFARWESDHLGIMALALDALTVARVKTWGKRTGLSMPRFALFSTPFAGTYEQWITGMNYIVEQAWLRSGCRGSESPVAAFEAYVRREYLSAEPFWESLLTFTLL